MDPELLRRHRVQNGLQSALLVAVMAALLGWLAWVVGGGCLLGMAIGMVLFAYMATPRISPRFVLRAFRARPLHPEEAPALLDVMRALAQRAELPAVPALYYLPTDVLNAFAVGHRGDSAIALSDGLLRRLTLAEVAGVLAHEVSHVASDDTRVMGFADMVARATTAIAQLGLAVLFLSLPAALLGLWEVPWLAVLGMLLAPSVSVLAQLALSRAREYDADLEGARLLGDPRPLAAALVKMERWRGSAWHELLFPGQRLPDPCHLRTHPPTGERVERLLALAPRPAEHGPLPVEGGRVALQAPDPFRPRWHRSGLWF